MSPVPPPEPTARATAPEGARLVEDAIWDAARAHAGEVLHDDDELRAMATGLPHAEWNGVYRARPRPGTSPGDLVERATADFAARDLPFTWHLGPDTDPRIEAVLLDAGLPFEEEEPGMVALLDDRHAGPAAPPAGLELVPVTTDEQLDGWVRVLTGGDPRLRALADARRPAALGTDGPVAAPHVLACQEGRPVGCAAVFLGRPAAVVDHVVTLPEARNRGVGTALTAWALATARRDGLRIAVLTASPQGRGIYARMGFDAVGAVRRYRWAPR